MFFDEETTKQASELKDTVKKLLGLRSASAEEAEAEALAATPAYDYDKDKADNWDDTLPCKTKFLSSQEDCDEDCTRMYTIESQKDICMEKSDKLRENLKAERQKKMPNPYAPAPPNSELSEREKEGDFRGASKYKGKGVSVATVLGYIVLLTLVVLYGVALGYTAHYIWSGDDVDDASDLQKFLMRSGTIVSFTIVFGGVLAVFASRA